MPNFYQLGDGTWINVNLIAAAKCEGNKVFFNYSGGHIKFIASTKEDAEQEVSNFLAHCEGQFED